MPKNGDTKPGWVVLVNSDLTEGRGHNVPLYCCASMATAHRLAAGRSTQGSDGEVREIQLVYREGFWCGPTEIQAPSKEDLATDKEAEEVVQVLQKAKAAGLTAEELKVLLSSSTAAKMMSD